MPIDSLDEEGLSLKELLQKYNEQGEILFPVCMYVCMYEFIFHFMIMFITQRLLKI